ncbi:MAG: mechanosensitive ion channel family protein [Anaerolineae bacterium]
MDPTRVTELESWLADQGWTGASGTPLSAGLILAAGLVLAAVSFFVAERLVLTALSRWSHRTSATWDDAILDNGLVQRAAYLAPILVMRALAPIALGEFPRAADVAETALELAAVLIGAWAVAAALNTVGAVYSSTDQSREVPLRGPLQAAKLVVGLLALLLSVAIVFDRSPIYLLTGLGALSAVLLLVFRDPILGFVAGIQLTTNRMVSPGDWIEMPEHNADGEVLEVGLTTVKVRNWDNTITMIPTYALVSESFKNWRGMQESGGRRIRRAINLDVGSINFLTDEMVDEFGRIELIADYIAAERSELAAHNEGLETDGAAAVNTRRLTNVGVFRAYIEAYLRQHPQINQDMTLLVRQLPPTEHGLPLEVYAFSSDTESTSYEAVQADIFDHLLAVAPEFGLPVFQAPAGTDLRR